MLIFGASSHLWFDGNKSHFYCHVSFLKMDTSLELKVDNARVL